MADNRFVVIPDSPEGISDDKIHEEIDDVVDEIIEYLTTQPPRVIGGGPATKVQRAEVEHYQGNDQLDALDRFNRMFLEKSRGDGFSLTPPTPERVASMLKGTTLRPDEVVAVLQPGMGIATVEKIAISCVMAGCEPTHLPVILAAVRAIDAMGFYARAWLMSTSINAPMLFVSGPIVEELGIHTGQCTLGPSKWSMTNMVLGRALQLVLKNVGYHRPREMDMDTIGTPLKWSLCTAENQERNPWQPFQTDYGFGKDTNVVGVTSVTNQLEVPDHLSKQPEPMLNEFVYSTLYSGLSVPVSNREDADRPEDIKSATDGARLFPGGLFIMLAPEHAELLSRFGWTRQQAKEYIWKNQKMPARWVANLTRWRPPHEIRDEWKWLLTASDEELDTVLVPSRTSPAEYHLAVVGGWGAKSIVYTTSQLAMVEITDRVAQGASGVG